MKLKSKILFVLPVCALFAFGCGKKRSATADSVGDVMSHLTLAMNSAADSKTGILAGSDATMMAFTGIHTTADDFDYKSLCKTDSGSPKDGSTVTPAGSIFIYCNLRVPADGPDTVGGGMERARSFLCALGDQIVYDGAEHEVTMNFTTDCFTQSFVDMVKQQLGKTSATVKITGFSSVPATVGPTQFDKYFLFKPDFDGGDNWTIFVKDTDNKFGVALKYGLPDATDSSSVFSVMLDKAEGTLRYEGRFSGGSQDGGNETRHVRAYLKGTIDDNFNFTEVQNLSFVTGELSAAVGGGGGGGSFIHTMKGTPGAGRKIISKTGPNPITATGDLASADVHCVGETGVQCTGNAGIDYTDHASQYPFFMKSTNTSWTKADAWFKANSYLTFTDDLSFADTQ